MDIRDFFKNSSINTKKKPIIRTNHNLVDSTKGAKLNTIIENKLNEIHPSSNLGKEFNSRKNFETNLNIDYSIPECNRNIIYSNSSGIYNGGPGCAKTEYQVLSMGYQYKENHRTILCITKMHGVKKEIAERLRKIHSIPMKDSGSYFINTDSNKALKVSTSDSFTHHLLLQKVSNDSQDDYFKKYNIGPREFASKKKCVLRYIDSFNHPQIGSHKIRIIYIDEYQDLEQVDVLILVKLCTKFNIIIKNFGDILQSVLFSIDKNNFFDIHNEPNQAKEIITKYMPDIEEEYLTVCYRCHPNIVQFYNKVMERYLKFHKIPKLTSSQNIEDGIISKQPVIFFHHAFTTAGGAIKSAKILHTIYNNRLKEFEHEDIAIKATNINSNQPFVLLESFINEDANEERGEDAVIRFNTKLGPGEHKSVDFNKCLENNCSNCVKERPPTTKLLHCRKCKTLWKKNKSSMSSIHAYKGKETEVSIVPGMTKQSLPKENKVGTEEELSQYSVLAVGISRAKKELYVGCNINAPSPYIRFHELNKICLIANEKYYEEYRKIYSMKKDNEHFDRLYMCDNIEKLSEYYQKNKIANKYKEHFNDYYLVLKNRLEQIKLHKSFIDELYKNVDYPKERVINIEANIKNDKPDENIIAVTKAIESNPKLTEKLKSHYDINLTQFGIKCSFLSNIKNDYEIWGQLSESIIERGYENSHFTRVLRRISQDKVFNIGNNLDILALMKDIRPDLVITKQSLINLKNITKEEHESKHEKYKSLIDQFNMEHETELNKYAETYKTNHTDTMNIPFIMLPDYLHTDEMKKAIVRYLDPTINNSDITTSEYWNITILKIVITSPKITSLRNKINSIPNNIDISDLHNNIKTYKTSRPHISGNYFQKGLSIRYICTDKKVEKKLGFSEKDINRGVEYGITGICDYQNNNILDEYKLSQKEDCEVSWINQVLLYKSLSSNITKINIINFYTGIIYTINIKTNINIDDVNKNIIFPKFNFKPELIGKLELKQKKKYDYDSDDY